MFRIPVALAIAWVAAARLVCAEAPAADVPPAAGSAEWFQDQIVPLLARRCLSCHDATERKGNFDLTRPESLRDGGDSGAAVVPGEHAESLLWQRVSQHEMPPDQPLNKAEIELLARWIDSGARWHGGPIDIFRYTTEGRAGYDWWALQPLRADLDERLAERSWAATGHVENPIDVFVSASLRERGLGLSPPADRRTLVRRLSFDLLGLPPDEQTVKHFLTDPAPDAYAALAERLLASPHYGERWARHWLDLARFGESQGFERDRLRSNAWRYRDWLIDAWNSDLPYDRFARWQLAGDVLENEAEAALVATGFLVAGPYDEVGQNQQSAAMKAVVRQDELEDIVSVVSQTFLGLTVNCARCHDHKFDPIRQSEYYQLTAALAGVRHGERRIADAAPPPRTEVAVQGLSARMRYLEQQLEQLERPIRTRILAARRTQDAGLEPPRPISRWDFDEDLRDQAGSLHGIAEGAAALQQAALRLDGESYVATAPLDKSLTEKTLEVWVSSVDLQQRGGGVFSIQTLDGTRFDALVYGEREPGRWMAGSNNFERTESFGGPAEEDADAQPIHLAVVYESDGTVLAYRNGQPYGRPYQSRGLLTFKAGRARVLFGLRHTPPGGNRFFRGAIHRAQLYDRALSPLEIAASAGVESAYVADEQIVEHLTDEQRQRRESLQFELAQLHSQRQRYDERSVYAVTPRPPGVAHVLDRGNPAQQKEVVAAGGVAALRGVQSDFGLSAEADDASRRRRLAAWITDHRNPLFARVIVNRLWHYHFGVGLVDTPNDFGFNGGRPTHPLLLDWLARELIRRRWSLKAVQRLIVTSAVYRQSSRRNETAMQIDADNRLLWRKSPRRLEAEAVRDAMLAVSGELNTALYGPGYHDFQTFTNNSQFYKMRDPQGPTFHRRSLYRTWVRSGRNQFLDVFDCPDPSAKAPRRAVTTTPLQALSLQNDSFVLRMADRFAARVRRSAGSRTDDQIRRAYELAFARPPGEVELAVTRRFADEHGLPALCRVLFNTNEFLYVD